MSSSLPDRKSLRKRLITAREALPENDRLARNAALQAHLAALLASLPVRTIGFCWPYRAEPDVRETVAAWLRADPARRAALPVVLADEAPLVFRAWSPDVVMKPDRYGIPVPAAGDALQPDALLIPVNGFNARGYRLGYGGGYFDRTLAQRVPRPHCIGVAFELARCEDFRESAQDEALDWIVTESGCTRFERA